MPDFRYQFEKEFLSSNKDYSIADLSYDFKSQTYQNPYINSSYQQFLHPSVEEVAIVKDVIDLDMQYYICVNKQVVLALNRFEKSRLKYIEKLKKVCKVFGAKGFYPSNDFSTGFKFGSFIFDTKPSGYQWTLCESGGYMPKTRKGLLILNSYLLGLPPVSYEEVLKSLFGEIPSQSFLTSTLKELQVIDDVVIISLTKPLESFGICIPTTKDYIEYLLNNEF